MKATSVRFSRKDPQQFFQTIRKRVNDYFEENQIEKTGNWKMYLKTMIMYTLYLAPLVLILVLDLPVWAILGMYILIGLGKSGIGLAVMHDANHGSYSKYKWVNQFVSRSMDFIGSSSFTWNIQHNVMHHSYTNIYELDEDIDDKPFLRLSPYGKLKKHHRFQHIYALFIYSLATLSWTVQKDFRQLVAYFKSGVAQQNGYKMSRELPKMILWKSFYFGYMIVLPIVMGVPVWLAILGFVLVHMVAGFLITVIFQLAHVVEGPDHFTPDPSGTMNSIWAAHQLKTTANFCRKNKFITWFVGGLNHQVEHHLFPKICHIHYDKISEIVKSTAEEFNLPYYEYDSFLKAVGSHLRVLKSFGRAQAVAIA